jgi:hypothetical protein
MVEADLLDKLCKIGSILTRRPTSPFGGMQVRLLPTLLATWVKWMYALTNNGIPTSWSSLETSSSSLPLSNQERPGSRSRPSAGRLSSSGRLTCRRFSDRVIPVCVFSCSKFPCVEKHTDSCPAFVNMLNEMRFGQMKPESVARFKALAREVKYEDGINATELYVAILFPACETIIGMLACDIST